MQNYLDIILFSYDVKKTDTVITVYGITGANNRLSPHSAVILTGVIPDHTGRRDRYKP